MKKIPTLFDRDWDGKTGPPGRHVLPGPPLVDLVGAIPTRKRDGTACMIRGGRLYKRYDAKHGRTPPPDFELIERDDKTGHAVGWVPVGDGPEDRWHRAALLDACQPNGRSGRDICMMAMVRVSIDEGTYELCGPKVQGNPEDIPVHALIPHGEPLGDTVPTDFDGLKSWLANHAIEGIVWWRNGEAIAKIKRKDFGLPWPIRQEQSA